MSYAPGKCSDRLNAAPGLATPKQTSSKQGSGYILTPTGPAQTVALLAEQSKPPWTISGTHQQKSTAMPKTTLLDHTPSAETSVRTGTAPGAETQCRGGLSCSAVSGGTQQMDVHQQ